MIERYSNDDAMRSTYEQAPVPVFLLVQVFDLSQGGDARSEPGNLNDAKLPAKE